METGSREQLRNFHRTQHAKIHAELQFACLQCLLHRIDAHCLKIQAQRYNIGFQMQFLQSSLVELITQTATNLPPDVRAAMSATGVAEKPNTQASQALNIIFSNIDMAADDSGPICQDTGMPTFYIHTPVGVNQIAIKKAIRAACLPEASEKACEAAGRIRCRLRLPARTAATTLGPGLR